MRRISRAHRAELNRAAQRIRREAQRDRWPVDQIAIRIVVELPEIIPLHAWRLAYGWSRQQVLDGVAALYRRQQLHPPPMTTMALSRWEHGQHRPSQTYLDDLCRLYQTSRERLGFGDEGHRGAGHRTAGPNSAFVQWGGYDSASVTGIGQPGRFREAIEADRRGFLAFSAGGMFAAMLESLQLGLAVDGPAGGTLLHEQLDEVVEYYALHYNDVPPAVVFEEVSRCRHLVTEVLAHPQSSARRQHLLQASGWLSGLLGNAAFHLSDYKAAHTHLGTAHQLGVTVGDARLVAWARGAQSMLAWFQNRYEEAAELARDGLRSAPTPLARAQLLAWGELLAVASMQRRNEATRVLHLAQRELEKDPVGSSPGRFGFDLAEFEQHASTAWLALGAPDEAHRWAMASQERRIPGTAGWGGVTLMIGLAEAQRGRPDQAAELGLMVLREVPLNRLRETIRKRLRILDTALAPVNQPTVQGFRERLRSLPPATPLGGRAAP